MEAQLPIYITPEGYKKVKDELDALWHVERPRVTAEVSAAAELGDRSENAEYIYGKKRLREIDKRMQYLAGRIERMHVVHPEGGARTGGKVAFGAWVVLDDEDGERHSYRIVGPDESDAEHGHISMDSPMGRALMGKAVDDEVTVQRPRGSAVFSIVQIHHGARPG
ncbi:MAG: transcription elongation factor GreB [Deltaproteobacteria bacterium]|nr:transcription elongation factor GreB [Nannocystaceae bacterium]